MMRDRQPNGRTAHRFRERGGGYDRNLTLPKTIHAAIEYVHANPVRRGLVDSPDEWAWSSARCFTGAGEAVLVPDIASIPGLGPV